MIEVGRLQFDNFNFKGKQRKLGCKTLVVGLSLAFLMIVTGLITVLIVLKLQNLKLESKHQLTEDLLHAHNMSQAQLEDLVQVSFKHLKEVVDDKGLLHEAIKKGNVERVKLE